MRLYCYRIRQRFSDILDGALTPAQLGEAQGHLEKCERCAGEFELLRRSHALVRSLEPIPVPEDFTETILARVRLAGGAAAPEGGRPVLSLVEGSYRSSRWIRISLAAAAAVAVLGMGVWVWKTTPRMNSASAPVANSAATNAASAGAKRVPVVPVSAAQLAAQTSLRHSVSGNGSLGKARSRKLPSSPALARRAPADSLFDQPYQGGELQPVEGYIQRVQSTPDSGVHLMPASPGRGNR
jgi:anti-sigma factor RsiW